MRDETQTPAVTNSTGESTAAKRSLALGTGPVLLLKSFADIEGKRRKSRCGEQRLGRWG